MSIRPNVCDRRSPLPSLITWVCLLAILGLVLAVWPSTTPAATAGETTIAQQVGTKDEKLRYDQLRSLLVDEETLVKKGEKSRIKSVEVDPDRGSAIIRFTDGSKAGALYPPDELHLADRAADLGADVTIKRGGDEGDLLLLNLLPLSQPLLMFIIVGFIISLIVISRSQVKNQGLIKTKARQENAQQTNRPAVTFNDVAGCDEAVEELRECVLFLKEPEKFHRMGADLPNGILLHGDPGTGKTLMAKALAGEAGIPFYACSASEFVEMYVGVGAARIRSLFQKADKSEQGAVIFIDEIDAIGCKRGKNPHDDERERTLNELLVQLDGFKARSNVIVIGATNRIDELDPALLRPGRLSRQIAVPLPDEKGRREILELYLKDKLVGDDVDVERLAHITSGRSGADLAMICNEAAILAVRENHPAITDADMEEAHIRLLAGNRRLTNPTAEEREQIAWHEAGHVICGEYGETTDKAQLVSIQARSSGAGGLALWGSTDRTLVSPQYVHERLVSMLGGRAAEFLLKGEISSGATNDLQQAHLMARKAIEHYGFSEQIGPVHHQHELSGENSKNAIDDEVAAMVSAAYEDAIELLRDHYGQLKALAEALLDHEKLGRPEIDAVLNGSVYVPAPERTSRQHRGNADMAASGRSRARGLNMPVKLARIPAAVIAAARKTKDRRRHRARI